jgi:copper chaperone CopZ
LAGALTTACDTAPQRAEARADTSLAGALPGASQPATAASTAPPADTQRVVLGVKGMYCASCERTVTAMLRRTPGVLRANVNVDRAEATVVYDSARTSPAKLVEVVTTLGYDASVKRT